MIAGAGWLDHASWQRVAVGAAIALLIVTPGMRLRALSLSGAIAAFAVGTICFGAGGLPAGAALIAFFVSGSLLSRLKTPAGARADRRTGKTHTRDARQVLANGGIAALCALFSAVDASRSTIWLAGAVGALAAAAGDTWATEIGALSRAAPRSMRTGRRVMPGASGGVTALGTAASFVGGAVVGMAAVAFARSGDAIAQVVAAGGTGLAGSALDSLLGAHCQAVFACRACREISERSPHACGRASRLVRGLAWLDNDGVNAITTAFGALLAAALALITR